MTPDELREIDARIAVAFFGWRWVRIKSSGFNVLIPAEDHEQRAHFLEPGDSSGKRCTDWDRAFCLPQFTTDPGAAMMLWDKLKQAYCVEIRAGGGQRDGASVVAHGEEYEAEAETWPLALCKAALAMAKAGAKGATT